MSDLAKKLALGVVSMTIAYSLCLAYSALVVAGLGYLYLTKKATKFWIPKDHSKPPKCLTDPKYGEHKYATVNGVKLHYVTKGSESKPLMLFIHGFPEFWYSWRYQLIEFSKDYRTVALDMRGFSDSAKPSGISPYKVENMRTDIKAFIEHLGYEKCVLVCHDWGAVIGWSFVEHHMNMVERYVMMGAPESKVWRQSMTSSFEQFRKSWYVFMFQMPRLPEFALSIFDYSSMKSIGGNKFSETFTEEDLEAYKYTFSKPGALTSPINYYRANLRFFGVPKSPKLVHFAPGLFLLGEKDAYISRETGPMLQKRMKNLRFEVVEGANHFLQQDAPAATNALMRKFLKED